MLAPVTISKAQFARRRGCTDGYISKLIRTGKLRPPAVTPDGRIDIEAADAMLGQPAQQPMPTSTIDDSPVSPPEPTEEISPLSYAANRARREAANAKIAELELGELNGELVRRDVIGKEIADEIGGLRDALLMIPREIAGQCAMLADERAIEAVMTLALKRVFSGKASGKEALAA